MEGYLDGLKLDTGWLVIFDRRKKAGPLAKRLGASQAKTPRGKMITVVRA